MMSPWRRSPRVGGSSMSARERGESKAMRQRNRKPPFQLQESILTALSFEKEHGAEILARGVTARHFDQSYVRFAEIVIGYWQEHQEPPGRAHLDDLIAIEVDKR